MTNYPMSYVANDLTDDVIVLHRQSVLTDPEFIKRVSAIRRELRLEPPEYVLWLAVKDGEHTTAISIGSKQSLKPIERLSDKHTKRIMNLSSSFKLPLEDVVFFINGNEQAIRSGGPRQVKIEVHGNGVDIRISSKASRKEVNNAVEYIFKHQMPNFPEHKRKNKPPENYDLVYAVFRQRSKGKKFSEIYMLYRQGQLPLYKGSSTQYDEETLERYYRRYKPQGAR